jgi:hypothetical protein
MRVVARGAFVGLIVSSVIAVGCAGSGGGADATGGDPCDGIGMSQPATAPCCLEYGIDACGASLFCAAFDGRLVPTCYLERSRRDLEECGADLHCISGSCNTDALKCRSLAGQACDAGVGCAPAPNGVDLYVCDGHPDGGPANTCKLVGRDLGDPCLPDNGCEAGACIDTRCSLLPPGTKCAGKADCASHLCVGGTCSSGEGGAHCSSDDHCNGSKDFRCTSLGICSQGQPGSVCGTDDDCHSRLCVTGTCSRGIVGDPCADRGDCSAPYGCSGGTCQQPTADGQPCTGDDECGWSQGGGTYHYTSVCDPAKHVCLRIPGSWCEYDHSVCQSGLCTGGYCGCKTFFDCPSGKICNSSHRCE